MSQMSHVPTKIAKATLSSLFDRMRVTIIPNVPCPQCPDRSHSQIPAMSGCQVMDVDKIIQVSLVHDNAY